MRIDSVNIPDLWRGIYSHTFQYGDETWEIKSGRHPAVSFNPINGATVWICGVTREEDNSIVEFSCTEERFNTLLGALVHDGHCVIQHYERETVATESPMSTARWHVTIALSQRNNAYYAQITEQTNVIRGNGQVLVSRGAHLTVSSDAYPEFNHYAPREGKADTWKMVLNLHGTSTGRDDILFQICKTGREDVLAEFVRRCEATGQITIHNTPYGFDALRGLPRCKRCEREIALFLDIPGGQYLCDTCMEKAYNTCAVCGRPHQRVETYDTHTGAVRLCDKCAGLYRECICGMWGRRETFKNVSGKMVCPVCYEASPVCECGARVLNSLMHTMATPEGDVKMCHACFNRHGYVCQCCGNVNDKRRGHYEVGTSLYCHNCGPRCIQRCGECGVIYISTSDTSRCKNCRETIHPYGWEPDQFVFHGRRDKYAPYMGLEWEKGYVGGNGRRDSETVAQRTKEISRGLWYCGQDCTTGDYGLEFISHPVKYHKWCEDMGTLHRINEAHKALKYASRVEGLSLGLHVNLSREHVTPVGLYRMLSLFYRNPTRTLRLSGRTEYNMSRHARLSRMTARELMRIARRVKNSGGTLGHTDAINLSNAERIEMRIFASTDDITRLLDIMELFHALVVSTDTIENAASYPRTARWCRRHGYKGAAALLEAACA